MASVVLDVTSERVRPQRSVRRIVTPRRNSSRLLAAVITFLTLVATLAGISFPGTVSQSVFVPLIVCAGFLLSGRTLARAIAVVVAGYLVVVAYAWGDRAVEWSVACVVLAVVGLVFFVTRNVQALGVPLSVGSGMLKDLRERLDRQALAPELPDDVRMEHCVLPAKGGAFSGDFVVCARHGDQLDVALTDVSGSGHSAGMRALLLSGAMSGLLGETDPAGFLPAANRYLIRQGWRDGFASAIHIALDLRTGSYSIGTAGHPSAAHYHADSRRWEMVTGAEGLLLGLFEQGRDDFSRAAGMLAPGDVVVLYSDGVVEGPGGDITAGTQRLLAMTQSAISEGLTGGAHRICTTSAALGGDDDRSVVVIWRDGNRRYRRPML